MKTHMKIIGLLTLFLLGAYSCSSNKHIHGEKGIVTLPTSETPMNVQMQRLDRMGNPEVGPWFVCFRPFQKAGVDLPRPGKRMTMPCTQEFVRKIFAKYSHHDFSDDADFSGLIKDYYNQDDAFSISPTHENIYRELYRASFLAWDQADSLEDFRSGKEPLKQNLDWSHYYVHGVEHPLLNRFVSADYLLIDTTKGCGSLPGNKPIHMDIEMSLLNNVPDGHKTCGGRTPNDDVIDTIVTLYMNGPNRLPAKWWNQFDEDQGPQRKDGFDKTEPPVPNEFPWIVIE